MRTAGQFPGPETVLFWGTEIATANIPAYYVPAVLAVKLPELLVGLGGIGLVAALFARPTDIAERARLRLVLLWFVVPAAYIALFRVRLYDNERHVLFLVPSLAHPEPAGCCRRSPGDRQHCVFVATGAVLGAVLLNLRTDWRLHPYEYTYFNAFVGGLHGAEGRFATDYWGLSTRELLEKVPRHSTRETTVRVCMVTAAARVMAPPRLRGGIRGHPRADFTVCGSRWGLHLKWLETEDLLAAVVARWSCLRSPDSAEVTLTDPLPCSVVFGQPARGCAGSILVGQGSRLSAPEVGLPNQEYVGSELELFALAERWKSYLLEAIAPHLGSEVLEVGAGLGATTEFLCRAARRDGCASNPTGAWRRALSERIRAGELPRCCEVVSGTLDDLDPRRDSTACCTWTFSSMSKNDAHEIASASRRLAHIGRLIVLAPAHQWLFSPFDAAIGHHRRYSKHSLGAVMPPYLRCVRLAYLDLVGLLASVANRLALRQSMPTRRQILFWDRVLVRLSRRSTPLSGSAPASRSWA